MNFAHGTAVGMLIGVISCMLIEHFWIIKPAIDMLEKCSGH